MVDRLARMAPGTHSANDATDGWQDWGFEWGQVERSDLPFVDSHEHRREHRSISFIVDDPSTGV